MMNQQIKEHPKYDFGTPEVRERFLFKVETDKEGKRLRNISSHPLDYYFSKDILSQRQHEAGIKLHRDFEVGNFVRYGASSCFVKDRVDGTRNGDNLADHQLDARARWNAALDYLGDDISKKLACTVCCMGHYLAALTIPYYATSALAMPRLKEVLDKLADHYGMPYPAY